MESGQSQPEIDKIAQLSEVFGVTTDFLLKDIVESGGNIDIGTQEEVEKVDGKIDISENGAKKDNRMREIFWGICIIIIVIIFFYMAGRVIGQGIAYLLK